ncbi:HK97 gp10 family phage protein [Massilia sp. RP-1-19]|uniref:HK97 gp10 family phage protein n=1 Tax=Massilia polaris TaxID=2728846 RepID=A0A848HNU4_9BURK|nr:HK97 gp10 family phage protein [Massilia polaris]
MADQIIKGGKELDAFLRSLPVKVERNIMRAALRAGAAVLRDEARANVPVDSGALRKSIKVSTGFKKGVVRATVKTDPKIAYYAHMVEYGTKPHLIKVQDSERPINWRLTGKRNKLTYMSMRTINRNALKIGNTFIGPVVSHPGAKPSPFMRPSFDSKSGAAIEAVTAKIRERLTKEGINVPAPEAE